MEKGLQHPYPGIWQDGVCSYGGNQGWAGDRNLRRCGCGLVAALDLLWYLKQTRPDWPTLPQGRIPEEETTRVEYEAMLTGLQESYLPLVPPFGMSGLVLALGMNRCFRNYGIPLKARWGCSGKKLPLRLDEMLQKDLPVILAVGPNFPFLWRKNRVTLYRQDGSDNWVAAAMIKAHFVTVTGREGDWVYLASWGRNYRFSFQEYTRYIRRHSSYLVSNLLYLQEK